MPSKQCKITDCEANSAENARTKRKHSDSGGHAPAPKQSRGNQSKYWMFTINNPVAEDEPKEHDLVDGILWQKEKGAEETEHYQGYLELKKRLRLEQLKKQISFLSRSHLEPRRGSREQAWEYCTKEDTRTSGPWGIGTLDPKVRPLARKGKRKDMDQVCEMMLSGSKVEQVAQKYPGMVVRYSKGLRFLETMISKQSVPTWRKLDVQVLWGPTGTGKTRKAIELATEKGDWYMLSKTNNKQLWWDGYVGQPTVIMDEFRASWCPYDVLLRILDGHPYCPEQKGGHVNAAYTTVYITSNLNPNQWYSTKVVPDQTHLFRRITEMWIVDKPLYDDIKIVDSRDAPLRYWPIFGQAKGDKPEERQLAAVPALGIPEPAVSSGFRLPSIRPLSPRPEIRINGKLPDYAAIAADVRNDVNNHYATMSEEEVQDSQDSQFDSCPSEMKNRFGDDCPAIVISSDSDGDTPMATVRTLKPGS